MLVTERHHMSSNYAGVRVRFYLDPFSAVFSGQFTHAFGMRLPII